jgi:hypothetical protein
LFCNGTSWRISLFVSVTQSNKFIHQNEIIFKIILFDRKLGAAWFCFGLLIHSILSLTYQSIYFIEDSECRDGLQLAVDILFPIWALLVLFFIFKYCNIIINSYRGVARLLIMHAIGTSLAFWIFTIVRETTDAIAMKSYGKYPSSENIVKFLFDIFKKF